MMKHAFLLALAFAVSVAPARAQSTDDDKGDAKALMASGLKLFAAKDYLGALSVFETAYERYPSPKILLNIGTTLLKLDRKAEAANTYQRYLDAKDVDTRKQAEAQKILAGLDKELGVLDISTTPESAEIQIGDGKWVSIETTRRVRVKKGEVTILARAPTYKLRAETITISAGETKAVALALEAEPVISRPSTDPVPLAGGGIATRTEPTARARIGALVAWRVDPFAGNDTAPFGSTFLVGAGFDVTSRISVHGAALLAKRFGGYLGASYAFLPGKVRPLVAAGVPILFSDGARFSVRGAAGVELVINRHVSVIAEIGVERFLNAEDFVMNETLFVPSLGATGRL